MLVTAAALGASLAWASRGASSRAARPGLALEERRDLFPEGVASGDPHPHSVLLWTRRPPLGDRAATVLRAQAADDAEFKHIVASRWRWSS
jgi:alkaline phosphatase D